MNRVADTTSDDAAPLTRTQASRLLDEGFLAVPDMTDEADIAFIRGLIEPMLDDPALTARTTVRQMGGAKDAAVREIHNLATLEPRLKQSRFFRRAWAITEALFHGRPQLKFDHVIDKPAFSEKATDWHQDVAYSSRLTLSAKRLHWWLPLRAVEAEDGCMQYVPGSHRRALQRHQPIEPGGHILSTAAPDAPAVVCPLPLGGASVHLPKTLHYSGPNHSALARTAWIVQIGVLSWPTLL